LGTLHFLCFRFFFLPLSALVWTLSEVDDSRDRFLPKTLAEKKKKRVGSPKQRLDGGVYQVCFFVIRCLQASFLCFGLPALSHSPLFNNVFPPSLLFDFLRYPHPRGFSRSLVLNCFAPFFGPSSSPGCFKDSPFKCRGSNPAFFARPSVSFPPFLTPPPVQVSRVVLLGHFRFLPPLNWPKVSNPRFGPPVFRS